MSILHVVLDDVTTPKKIEMSGSTTFNHLVYLIDVYSACVDNHPYIYPSGTTSLLSCGVLSATTGVVGDYLIEWHLNSTTGTIILISGNLGNSDPNIEVYHPFTNQPVPGGTLYPVIKYVWIDGFKYTSYYESGSRYSPDLISCLSSISILDMNCGNGVLTGLTESYTHNINYSWGGSLSNTGNSTRTVNFLLNTGGTTKYFAWEFRGFSVPDSIKITYSGSTSQVLTYWSVGTDIVSDFATNPRKFGNPHAFYQTNNVDCSLKSVVNLSAITYVDGDYLIIEVTPNQGNVNTNWQLYMKCFGESTNYFNCDVFPYGYNIIDPTSIYMSGYTGISSCYYQIVFRTYSGSSFASSNSSFKKYFSVFNVDTYPTNSSQYNYDRYLSGDTRNYINVDNYTGYTNQTALGNGSCYSATTSTFVSNGTTITATFANNSDYEYYKNSYHFITGYTNMSNYSPDLSNLNHYKRLSFSVYSGATCGDNKTGYTTYFHYSSVVTFDDTNKIITIYPTGSTNGFLSYSAVTCNNLYSTTNNLCTTYVPIFNVVNTTIKYQYPFGGYYQSSPNVRSCSGGTFYSLTAAHNSIINDVCALSNWFNYSGNTGDPNATIITSYNASPMKVMYRFRVKLEITDMTDPINNFILYEGLDENNAPTSWVQIYP